MSYYRYITGLYKSYWPQLNRTLRSSSVPRSVPELDTGRFTRASSVPPTSFYSNTFIHSATPFADRARSVPPMVPYTYRSSSPVTSTPAYTSNYSYSTSSQRATTEYQHYSDFDYKVIDYSNKLNQQDQVRSYVKQSGCRSADDYYRDGDHRSRFSSKYSFYDAGKFYPDYLYSSQSDVFGSWKHYNLSANTIAERNTRAKSPLISRELDRYYETKKRVNYMGDVSAGPVNDFRFYSLRRVPYFGGSDSYQYMKQKPRRH
eukprot:TRINITY_DN1594_c0_g1_i2.p1 TRINITY_DN1594_c0_g1~~TRINITY_DN1594_c0_g1_i2.p1  ORF type:complete len:260 (+),score=57.47 TRINITY_DN1594_c0_g1_i2:198-977(+)